MVKPRWDNFACNFASPHPMSAIVDEVDALEVINLNPFWRQFKLTALSNTRRHYRADFSAISPLVGCSLDDRRQTTANFVYF